MLRFSGGSDLGSRLVINRMAKHWAGAAALPEGPEDLKTFEVRSGRNTVLEFGCLSPAMFLLCTNVSVREMRGMLLINEFNTVVLV